MRHAGAVGDVSRTAADGQRDFFVSHSGHDRAWAEWVAWHLIDAGYSVELDCWDWAAGDNFVVRMRDALENAKRVIALYSPAYFEAVRYTTEEWSAALTKDEDDGPRLLPVRIEPCEVPRLLRPLLWCDLYDTSEGEALSRLLAAVRGPAGPQGRPAYPPRQARRRREASGDTGPRLPGMLPPVWNIQPSNPAFVGRDAALVELREQLLTAGTAVARALHGTAGVGKTQLAVEYAYRFAGSYQLAWWVAAEQTALIPTQLANLAVEAGIADRTMEIQAAVSALQADLRHRPGWLLIFDNAEEPNDVRPWLPSGPGHVLITSRNPNWGEIAAPVGVPVFAAEESVALLQRRVPGITEAEAGQVASTLDHLPLALSQAAGVLSETALPTHIYLENVAGHAAEMLTRGTPASYGQSLAATVQIAASRLTDADAPAGVLLRLSAHFGPEPIATSLFTAAPAMLPAPLAATAADPLALHQSLGLISRYGLAHLDHNGLQVHRVVQAILRDQSAPQQRGEDARCVAALLVASGPADTDDPATWPAWASLLPHLLAVNPAESTDPDIRRLAARALLYLLRRGDSRTAEQLAAAFFTRWRQLLGPDDADTLAAATELAHARRNLGRITEIREIIEDTLARRRRVLGDNHPDTLRSAGDLSVALSALGDRRAARELGEETLARARRTLGDDHHDTLRMANNLADDLAGLGDRRAARELAEDTLARRRGTLGDDHPGTLAVAASLARILSSMGDRSAGRELSEDALARARRALGDDHPETLQIANGLASQLAGVGDLRAARKLAEDTLARQRRILGEDHPSTLVAANCLAMILANQGDRQAARELAEDALARSRRLLGYDHPDTLAVASDLALCLSGLEDFEAARELAEDTLARMRRVIGDDHPTTLNTTVFLASALGATGELARARELAEGAVARMRRILGEDHPNTLNATSVLALILLAVSEPRAARELGEDTLARLRRTLGEDHPDTLAGASCLVMIHAGSRNLAEARTLADRTLLRYKRVLGPGHPDTQRLAQLCRHIHAGLAGPSGAFRLKETKKKRR
jgi:tetratricopeptide (TPR) repeat protein